MPGKGTTIVIMVLRKKMPITIYLADDHTLIREGLRHILGMNANFVVVGRPVTDVLH